MFWIPQVKAPNVELGNHLVVNQLVTLWRNGRPTSLTHRTGNRSRFTSVSRYSPQTLRPPTRRRKDDFAAVHSPSRRTNDGAMIEGESPGFATRCGNDIYIVAYAGDGGTYESDLRTVRRKVRVDLRPRCGRKPPRRAAAARDDP